MEKQVQIKIEPFICKKDNGFAEGEIKVLYRCNDSFYTKADLIDKLDSRINVSLREWMKDSSGAEVANGKLSYGIQFQVQRTLHKDFHDAFKLERLHDKWYVAYSKEFSDDLSLVFDEKRARKMAARAAAYEYVLSRPDLCEKGSYYTDVLERVFYKCMDRCARDKSTHSKELSFKLPKADFLLRYTSVKEIQSEMFRANKLYSIRGG